MTVKQKIQNRLEIWLERVLTNTTFTREIVIDKRYSPEGITLYKYREVHSFLGKKFYRTYCEVPFKNDNTALNALYSAFESMGVPKKEIKAIKNSTKTIK